MRRIRSIVVVLAVVAATLGGAPRGAEAQSNVPSFTRSVLQGHSSSAPTSLQFGPDGKLYVADVTGTVRVYEVAKNGPGDYSVVSTETIDRIAQIPNHDDDGSPATDSWAIGSRQVTGLVVGGTAAAPVLYVSSSDPRVGAQFQDLPLDTNSGIVSRLTQTTPGTWSGAAKVDLVRGLPRNEENHSINGMVLSPDGSTLYLAAGGNTNMGAPSSSFAFQAEYALSAAILAIDLPAIDAMPLAPAGCNPVTQHCHRYDLPTLNDPTRPDVGGADENDPFGGNSAAGGANQAVLDPAGPVQLHATGFRNPYDLLIASDGRMYTIDNGSNAGWGGVPAGEGPGGTCDNTANNAGSTLPDALHYVRELSPGVPYYGGHPNPVRGNPAGVLADTQGGAVPWSGSPVPLGLANPVECDARHAVSVGGQFENGALAAWPHSTNGIAEYTSSAFGGAMQGDILAAGWDSEQIVRAEVTYDGNDQPTVVTTQNLLSTGGAALDLDTRGDGETFPGTIWVANLYGSAGLIQIFEPDDTVVCNGGPGDDDDNDGFTNADELDNGTDPCSAASVPPDHDTDGVSDLNDPDDDNDSIPDVDDHFALDADNGASTGLPAVFEWEVPAGGILGLGFTGLMNNGAEPWHAQFDPTQMTAIGAAGVMTVDAIGSGSALGTADDQEFAFQFGFAPCDPSCAPHRISTEIAQPLQGIGTPSTESLGAYTGTGDQSNFAAVLVTSVGGAPGMRLVVEVDDVVTADEFTPVPALAAAGVVEVALDVDPTTGSVSTSYAIDGGPAVGTGDTASVPVSWYSAPVAAGIVATSGGAPPFTGTWNRFAVTPTGVDAGSWTIRQGEVNVARHENSLVAVGDRLYLLGGRGNPPVEIYDPATDTWALGEAPPIELHHFQAVEYGGLIYVVGAFTGVFPDETPVPNVYVYDPATDTWSVGPVIPTQRRRGSAGAAVVGDLIYVVGGVQQGHTDGTVGWVDTFAPGTGQWTALPNDVPHPRDHGAVAVLDNKLYVTNGRTTSPQVGLFDDTVPEVDVLDLSTATWSTLAQPLPTPRAAAAVAVLGDEILVIGGESGTQSEAHSEVEALDTTTGTWRTLAPLPSGQDRHGTDAAVLDCAVWVVAGSGAQGGSPELSTAVTFSLSSCPGGGGGGGGNTPPTVSLTAPVNGASATVGQAVMLSANAGDADGTVAQVEFLVNGAVVGTDATAPYSVSWVPAVAGVVQVTARATDNVGAQSVSAPVSVTVQSSGGGGGSITLVGSSAAGDNGASSGLSFAVPAGTQAGDVILVSAFAQQGVNIPTPAGFTVVADFSPSAVWHGRMVVFAKTATGTETQVSFNTGWVGKAGAIAVYRGAALPVSATSQTSVDGSSITLPAVTATAAGSRLVAFYGAQNHASPAGFTAASGMTEIAELANLAWLAAGASDQTVGAGSTGTRTIGFGSGSAITGVLVALAPSGGGGPVNTPPTVSLTSPANGATATVGQAVTLSATAGDADGTVTQVEFLVNGTVVGTDTTAPYSVTWTPAAAGAAQITARATDNSSAQTVSAPVSVTVNAAQNTPPTVSLTAPVNGASATVGQAVMLSANAGDADGTVAQVEFLVNGAVVGTDATAPYSVSWVPAVAGVVQVTARATDNGGAQSVSAPVSVTVQSSGGGGGSITLVGSSAAGDNGASSGLSFAVPAGTQAGDVILVSAFAQQGVNIPTPAGFTVVADFSPSAVWHGRMVVFAKTATGTETQVSFNTGWVGKAGAIAVYRGAALPVSAFSQASVDGSSITLPTVTATAAGSRLVAFYGAQNHASPAGFTAASGMTEIAEVANLAWLAAGASDQTVGAGSTGTRTIGFGSGSAITGVLVALAPSGGGGPVNTPPTVTVTTPANGATVTAGQAVTLSATAGDADGTVTQVEFLVNGTVVGIDATAPYSVSWTPAAAGAAQITARATDNSSAQTVSALVSVTVNAAQNTPPTVTVTAPANGATATVGQAVTLSATAGDADGTVTQVEFLVNGTVVGTDTTAPFTASWIPAAAGAAQITARATDNSSAQTVSAPVSVTVNAAQNSPPTVTVTAPANGSTSTVGQAVTLSATAGDADGTVTQVEFLVNGTVVGTDTTAPFSVSWLPAAAGAAQITARATDNGGAQTVSAPVSVSVQSSGGGGGSITLVGSSAAGDNGASSGLSFAVPAGTQAGDVILVSAFAEQGVTIPTPSGFTVVADFSPSASWHGRMVVFAKTATGTETQVSFNTGWVGKAGAIAVYRGAALPVSAFSQASVDGSSITLPAVTATAAGSRLVAFYGAQNHASPAGFTAPSGMTEIAELANLPWLAAGASDQTVGAGSTGTRTIGFGSGTAITGVLVALTPAG